jgi:cell division protein FtsL
MKIKFLERCIFVFLLFLLFVVLKQSWEYRQYLSKKDSINKEIIEITKENNHLRKEINLLKNNEFYIQLLARKQLGMIKDGERIYKFYNK